MKTRLTLIPVALLAASLVILAVACDGAGAQVTVEKGLAAAVGREEGTGVGAPAAATPAPYAAAIAAKEEAARSAYAGAAYPVAAYPIGGRGGEGLLSVAQFQGQAGITVQGYGRASAPAESARVQFVVSKSGAIYPEPLPAEPRAVPGGGVESEIAPATPPDIYPTTEPPSPITEADLVPLIDAIRAQGVSDADIEVVIYPGGGYYDPYGPGTARVAVNLRDPAGKVEPLVDAASQAVANSGTLFLQNVGVLYSVDDCSTLLAEARGAAVEDARENGAGLAAALGVNQGELLAASEYVYSPFGPSPCDPSFDTYYPGPYGYEGMAYDPAMPGEVHVVSNVTLTFAVR